MHGVQGCRIDNPAAPLETFFPPGWACYLPPKRRRRTTTTPAKEKRMPGNPRWRRRPPGSTWGDWGPDDQLGRLNLLTREKVLKGVAEVQEGKTFCLSL